MVKVSKNMERGIEFKFLFSSSNEYFVPLAFCDKGKDKSM